MSVKYNCPHCGKEIEEVSVIEMSWKKIGISAGLGIGCGLLVFPLMPGNALVGAVGAFIIGFIIVFLVTLEKPKKAK